MFAEKMLEFFLNIINENSILIYVITWSAVCRIDIWINRNLCSDYNQWVLLMC